MNGQLFQLIALSCHANAALAGERQPVFPDHLAYKFCRSVSFVVFRKSALGPWKEVPVAATPDAWFTYLAKQHASGVALTMGPPADAPIPERISEAFIGGGSEWSLEVLLPDNVRQNWMARWGTVEPEAADDNIWRVTYGCIGTVVGDRTPPPDVTAASEKLERALVAIRSFAERQGHLDNFVDTFKTALECLTAPPGRPAYPQDQGMEMLPPQAANLLQAAQCAWVFGGMGSWNDMGFEGETDIEYQRVSDELYTAINEGILAGANGGLASNARTGT